MERFLLDQGVSADHIAQMKYIWILDTTIFTSGMEHVKRG
jgi:hypothetical protein